MWGSGTSSRPVIPSDGAETPRSSIAISTEFLQNQAHQSIPVLAPAFGPGQLDKLLLPEACSLAPFLGVH